jgi:uncharacterized membrane protein YeaQ/YmgE (transglycosylase-associated protein family)
MSFIHSNFEGVVAWIALGFCAALIAMAWPMRRGNSVVANFGVGVLGAVVVGAVGFALSGSTFSNTSLALAVTGAFASLLAMHVVWARAVAPRLRPRHS